MDAAGNAEYKQGNMKRSATHNPCKAQRFAGMLVCLWISTYALSARNGPP